MRFGSCTLTDIVLEFIKIKNYTFQRYSRHLQDVESAPLWWMWTCGGAASLPPLTPGETVNPAFCSSWGPACAPDAEALLLTQWSWGPAPLRPPPQAVWCGGSSVRLPTSVLSPLANSLLNACNSQLPSVNSRGPGELPDFFSMKRLWGIRTWGPVPSDPRDSPSPALGVRTGFRSRSCITFSSPFPLQSWWLFSSALLPGGVYSTQLSDLRIPGLPHVPDAFGNLAPPPAIAPISTLASLWKVCTAGIWVWQRNKALFSFSLLLFAEASTESSLYLSMQALGSPLSPPLRRPCVLFSFPDPHAPGLHNPVAPGRPRTAVRFGRTSVILKWGSLASLFRKIVF